MNKPTLQDDYFFSTYADSWWDDNSKMNNLASFQPPRFEYFDRFVDRWEGKRVLDVGCGGGFTTEFLHERGAQVSGLDPSPKLIAAADRHAKQTGKQIEYTVGKSERLPYEDASFDIVTCVDVLEHVESPAQAVREIRRVLAPGGVFLYDTINRTVRSRFVMIWIPENVIKIVPKGAHTWKDFIKPKEMRRYLLDAGLTPVGKSQGIAIYGSRKDGSLITRKTGDLSSIYMGVARR
ncbi:bifunctional 2-polyprenyl-6-hydroxyphenol methylase/3-demethylubiquinol 3-O-methyltransferase UbiG [Streptomyces sp. NPDC093109]|uniref:bifunctional 2-polyprenyl-6-hydroxyphenol methylase/3-demethylubiquinol 3-O-methyltransferase UbiG n=1 Tax=Streptomyces sp. NPDC093109 TaxID=3154977 RepID=UPI00344D7CA2